MTLEQGNRLNSIAKESYSLEDARSLRLGFNTLLDEHGVAEKIYPNWLGFVIGRLYGTTHITKVSAEVITDNGSIHALAYRKKRKKSHSVPVILDINQIIDRQAVRLILYPDNTARLYYPNKPQWLSFATPTKEDLELYTQALKEITKLKNHSST